MTVRASGSASKPMIMKHPAATPSMIRPRGSSAVLPMEAVRQQQPDANEGVADARH